jgi:hypothetical protein
MHREHLFRERELFLFELLCLLPEFVEFVLLAPRERMVEVLGRLALVELVAA